MSVCIIDYGSGNVNSIKSALDILGKKSIISKNKKEIELSSHLILPGVGSFSNAISLLKKNIDLNFLENEVLTKQKPILGICVGMQIMANKGYEFGEHLGLGWVPGYVDKLDTNLRLPHVGWNEVKLTQNRIVSESEKPSYYFTHSFEFIAKDRDNVCGTTSYGKEFDVIISNKNIYGVQFHPEKSQKDGLKLLNKFLNLK